MSQHNFLILLKPKVDRANFKDVAESVDFVKTDKMVRVKNRYEVEQISES